MKHIRFFLTIVVLVIFFTGVNAVQSAQSVMLHLAWGSTDPLTATPRSLFPATLRLLRGNVPPQYFIVQFGAPITEGDRLALENTGARILAYLPDFAYIVYAPRISTTRLENVRNVRWVGEYLPAYRLAPALYRKLWQPVSVVEEDKPGQFLPMEDRQHSLYLTFFPTQPLEPILVALEQLGTPVLNVATSSWQSKIALIATASQIEQLLQLPGLSWLEEAPTWELHNDPAADIMAVRSVWNTHTLYGQGQIVAVADTGLDQGSTSPATLHDDFENGSGTSRVLAIYNVAGDGNSSDTNGHGTHVAGSVLGNGDLSGATPASHTFPSTAHVGMAPDAQLVMQDIMDNSSGSLVLPTDLNDLFNPIYSAMYGSNVARIHTNSWGSTVRGMYTTSSQEVDQFMWSHSDFLILFSAGNDGVDQNSDGVIDLTSVGAPGTAKNALTVGASENYRPTITVPWSGTRYNTAPIASDYRADEPWGMAAFSSRGYTLDGRYKPDIVAPGTYVGSTCSSVRVGGCSFDTYYILYSGTSMATPLTAGSATLARQYYQQIQGHTPSAALLKATLLNGAYDMYPGQYGTGATQEINQTRPSPQAGWGRVNLETTLFPESGRARWWWDNTSTFLSNLNTLTTGETVTYTFEVTQTAPLSITLVWNDYPGTPTAAGGLVNDLDLRLTDPNGTTYYANHAVQRGATSYLSYGGLTVYLTTPSAGYKRAVKFTATANGTLEHALFFARSATSNYPKSLTYEIYSVSGGLPGTLLASGTFSMRMAGWQVLELAGHGLSFSSGDEFFVSITLPDTDTQLAADNTAPIDNRSYSYSSGTWGLSSSFDYAIEATLVGSTSATPYDRVNNVEGIDLATPVTGVYTLTVSGYNVPQSPQPYALVVSAVGRLLGSEMVTQTIDATGVYTFGQTGVNIQFNSEDVNSVSIQVQRNYAPVTTNPGDKTVHRVYNIQTQGGTGTFNADLTFHYEQSEVPPGVIESNLQACRWNGSAWTCYASTVDTASNTVTVNGVTAFSPWILAEPVPTAIQVVSFDVLPAYRNALMWTVLSLLVTAVLFVTRRLRR